MQISTSNTLKVGSRVKLITRRHGDERVNPVWDGRSGNIVGTILELHDFVGLPIRVEWDNGKHNSYSISDLQEVIEDWDR